MAIRFLRHLDPHHAVWLDWILILIGSLLAMFFWPVTQS